MDIWDLNFYSFSLKISNLISNLLTIPTLISNNPIAIWGVINSILLIYFNKSSINNLDFEKSWSIWDQKIL